VIVVSNATPLITLAKVGYFQLLQKLFAEITITEETWNEVVIKGAGRSGSAETAQASWIQVAALADPTQLPAWRGQYNLGAGEVSTILLAKELSAHLTLIDERKARTLAASEGLIVSGSIAVLERGYRKKYVTDLRQTYLDLLAAKIWIDKKVLKQSLANLGLLPL
jgi:predicted nucleic acid-binding protein